MKSGSLRAVGLAIGALLGLGNCSALFNPLGLPASQADELPSDGATDSSNDDSSGDSTDDSTDPSVVGVLTIDSPVGDEAVVGAIVVTGTCTGTELIEITYDAGITGDADSTCASDEYSFNATVSGAAGFRTFSISQQFDGDELNATRRVSLVDAPDDINYDSLMYALKASTTPVSIVPNLGAGANGATFGVSPALPSGLSIDSATGEISGLANLIEPAVTYRITATNVAGTKVTEIRLAVVHERFLVNEPSDTNDILPGDGLCVDAGGKCSIRAAAEEINASVPGDTYAIQLPSGNLSFNSVVTLSQSTIVYGNDFAQTILLGGNTQRLFSLTANANYEFAYLQMDGAYSAAGHGAAITDGSASANLSLYRIMIYDAVASGVTARGAAVYSMSTGTLDLFESHFVQNRSDGDGGAIFKGGGQLNSLRSSFDSNISTASTAGAMHLSGDGVIESTLFKGNSAASIGALKLTTGSVTLTNSTFTGNSTSGAAGALALEAGAFVTAINNTFFDNVATIYGGALVTQGGTNFEAANNLFVANIAAGVPDTCTVSGNLFTFGGNLLDSADADCGFVLGDPAPAAIVLGAIQDNGGSIETHAITLGSPAHDGSASGWCTPTDARGVARPQGASCDIGAFEIDE